MSRALIEGALLVIIILFLFLGSWRTTVISVLAIPLSLLDSIIVLHLIGLEIKTMTLGGMCIAIGSLVDDAIIDVENVYKRLRQNHALPPDQRENAFLHLRHRRRAPRHHRPARRRQGAPRGGDRHRLHRWPTLSNQRVLSPFYVPSTCLLSTTTNILKIKRINNSA